MNRWRKFINSHKSVTWLVCAAVLVLLLSPLHIHIHHDTHHDDIGVFASAAHHDAATDHEHHSAAIHSVIDTSGHDGHEGVTPLAVKSDGINKNSAVKISFLFILSLVLFLTGFKPSTSFLRYLTTEYLSTKHFYISPPLRAPPLI